MFIKFIQTLSFALTFFFLASCNGQVQTTQQPTASTNEEKFQDFDPYFIDTKTVVSQFGPKNITRNIIQDKKGNMWLASWEGIIRYDGKSFTNYTLQENLRKYHVFSAFEDSKENLWFGTIRGGVYRYDGKAFIHYTEKDGLGDWAESIIEDRNGNIWFATDEGVVRYNGETFQNFTTKEGLIDDYVHCLLETKDGNIWIATTGGISIYDGKIFKSFNQTAFKPFVNIRTLIQDQKGNIWIGGQEGLFCYNPLEPLSTSIKTWTTKFAGYLYEDKKGTIWMAAFDTPSTMSLSKKEINSNDFIEVKKENGQIFGIVADKEGNIWYGKGDGICRFDPSEQLKTGVQTFTTFRE